MRRGNWRFVAEKTAVAAGYALTLTPRLRYGNLFSLLRLRFDGGGCGANWAITNCYRRSGVQFKVKATPARTHGQAAVWGAVNSVGSLCTPTLIRPDNERREKAHVFQIEAEYGGGRRMVPRHQRESIRYHCSIHDHCCMHGLCTGGHQRMREP
jgi:hypothetical protein